MSKNLLGDLMRQAKEMQDRMKQVQEEAGAKVIEASSGGGMVTVRVNGRQEVLSIRIEPDIVDTDDMDMLQDLITAAINEGLQRSKKIMEEEMKKLTGGLGMNIPGLF